MTEWVWKKLSQFMGWGAIAVLFALVSFAASIEIKDLDLWLHIGTGRYIVNTHTVPGVDF